MKKYEQLQTELQKQIENGTFQPGDKLPSENELCALYSVSRNVVRQALRNLENQGLTETIKGIGTFCRSKMREKQLTYNIGFISFFSHSYIFPKIIAGADSVLYQQGFHLLIGQSLYDLDREKKLLERFQQREVDGIIMEPIYDGNVDHTNKEIIQSMINAGIPVVFIDNFIPGIKTTTITLDDFKAGRQAAEYLGSRGHRKIALFYQEDYYTKIQRKKGAESFLQENASLGYQAFSFPFRGQGNNSTAPQSAETLFQQLDRGFTAVFCSSDEDAMHLIELADSYRIHIPEDISIIGFDNWHFSGLNRINLTTFEHASTHMGRVSANSLSELLFHSEDTAKTHILFEPALIERESVRDIRPV